MMRDHGVIGRHYAGAVTQIISGSIGFDDWEWGVDLFADDPLVFKKLIYEMRFDEASAWYAEFGPFYIGLQFSPEELPKLLAGEVPAFLAAVRVGKERSMSPALQGHFSDYASFHRTPGNQACHYVGIPLIVFSLLALLARVPLFDVGGFTVTAAELVLLGATAVLPTLDAVLAAMMLAASMRWRRRAASRPWRPRWRCSCSAGCSSSSATTSTRRSRPRSTATSPTCWSARSGSWPR